VKQPIPRARSIQHFRSREHGLICIQMLDQEGQVTCEAVLTTEEARKLSQSIARDAREANHAA